MARAEKLTVSMKVKLSANDWARPVSTKKKNTKERTKTKTTKKNKQKTEQPPRSPSTFSGRLLFQPAPMSALTRSKRPAECRVATMGVPVVSIISLPLNAALDGETLPWSKPGRPE